MTIFVDPYHTTAGVILDMTKTITPLKETTIRDSLNGTNLEVRTVNDVRPVFITGCRDSEQAIPSFAHPIFIKNFNGKSYLFTDMRLYISSGGTLDTIPSHIRRREEFDFVKARSIASQVWATGDVDRFHGQLSFAGDVFAQWIGQSIIRAASLDFVDGNKVMMIALAYWETLFKQGTVDVSKDEDIAMLCAQRASRNWKIPVGVANQFYRTVDIPMASIADFCANVVKCLNNVNLNPVPGRPETGFNLRSLLNLIADAWFSNNSKPILATSLEHPPTLCSIIYYCLNYNNFKRQTLGQIIESVGRGGKAMAFNNSFRQLLEDMTRPETRPVSVMEFQDPANYQDNDGAVAALMAELHGDGSSGFTKELNTNEDYGFTAIDSSMRESLDSNKTPGVTEAPDAAYPNRIANPGGFADGRPLL